MEYFVTHLAGDRLVEKSWVGEFSNSLQARVISRNNICPGKQPFKKQKSELFDAQLPNFLFSIFHKILTGGWRLVSQEYERNSICNITHYTKRGIVNTKSTPFHHKRHLLLWRRSKKSRANRYQLQHFKIRGKYKLYV